MQINIDMDTLKAQVKENPLAAIGIVGVAVSGIFSGTAKLMNANTGRKNSKTYRREVIRREKLR